MMRTAICTVVVLLQLNGSGICQAPTETTTSSAKQFTSPQAVYDAFRDAAAKGDIRAEFSCYSPRIRDEMIVRILDARSYTKGDLQTALDKVFQKYGLDFGQQKALEGEYRKRFQQKHGNEPGEFDADVELWLQINKEKITNQAAFFAEAAQAFKDDLKAEAVKWPSNLTREQFGGELRNLRVAAEQNGEVRATAVAAMLTAETRENKVSQLSNPIKQQEVEFRKLDREIQFQKTKDGWFVDHLGEWMNSPQRKQNDPKPSPAKSP